ncbi:MAG: serine--tRNA ligase, partial [Candidatus Thermoplasmatota archaeon]|nr:serine--tRNA ligase [Candidatus Thermoplasmatota archaeon]
DLTREASDLGGQIENLEASLDSVRSSIDTALMRLPNILDPDVPVGKDDTENVEVRRWGEPREVGFELRPHGELLEASGWGDFERGRKVSGAGFVFLRGDMVLLDLALQKFALDSVVERGYIPVSPPFLIRRRPYEGVVDLADFEDVMYKVEGEDLYLIATSEHPIAAMHMDEVLEEEALPLRYAGLSTNFRKEIGAHGVDTKGLFRMHQFNKVEQFIFSLPEDSRQYHEELIGNAEAIFQKLEIPHRVVNVSTGDIGTVAAKKYDLETWSPRQAKYVEVVSCSNVTDYQARRLNIKVGKRGGAKRLVHTLNSTAIATSRALVAVLEHYQNEDGTVTIPRVLRSYFDGRETLA